MTHADRTRAESFGDDAAQYDRARPSYPSELLDRLLADDPPPEAAVDVGCGTGIVAALLRSRGVDVVGVEPDARMAAVARAKSIAVDVAAFEDWEPADGRTFDLLTAGQSWHWVDPDRGAAAAARVLRSGGRFALFWNNLRHRPEVMAAFESIYRDLAPHLLVNSVALGTTGGADPRPEESAFAAHREFTDLEHLDVRWERGYTTQQWLDELPTHSGHRVLPRDTLARILDAVGRALDERGGELVVDYRTTGLTGRRR